MKKKKYLLILVLPLMVTFQACEDEATENDAYIEQTDSLSTQIEQSIDSLEQKADELDEAMEDLEDEFK